jgi:hypothetical protein
VVVFGVDQVTGKLARTDARVEVGSPASIVFVR